jgi:DNA-binding XRE family transcriptional regulator
MRKSPSGPNKVRMLRRRLGVTQRELAAIIGHEGAAQISRLESGRRAPHFVEALKLELLLGLPTAEIFTRLTRSALREMIRAIERLNRQLLQSSCQRVTHKAGPLTDILVSLRNQEVGKARPSPWPITPTTDKS